MVAREARYGTPREGSDGCQDNPGERPPPDRSSSFSVQIDGTCSVSKRVGRKGQVDSSQRPGSPAATAAGRGPGRAASS